MPEEYTWEKLRNQNKNVDEFINKAFDALEIVRDATAQFQRAGFSVNQTRGSYRIVTDEWEVSTVERLREDEFLDEIAARYVELVELGHEVFGEQE